MRSRSVHVAHIVDSLGIGGLERIVVSLVNAPMGYQQAIICFNDNLPLRTYIKDPNVQVISLGVSDFKNPVFHFRLFQALRILAPQIVHTHNVAALKALPPSFLASIPFRVHTEHGRNDNNPAWVRKRNLVCRALYPFVSDYVAVCNCLRIEMLAAGAAPERTVVIHNGVDTALFSPRRARNANSFSQFTIGTVGRLDCVKDPLTLIRAFIKLRKLIRNCRVRCILVGDGPLRRECLRLASAEGAGEDLELTGNRSDVADQLLRFDVFICSSLYEGSSLSILEAMGSGVPVIATDVGGNPELIRHCESGILVKTGDAPALARAAANYFHQPLLAVRHASVARTDCERHFKMSEMTDRYFSLYDRLLRHWNKRSSVNAADIQH